ncbi:MAG: porin, partial [Arenimonas sp.]
IGKTPPLREQPFKEIDGRPGWYAGASLREDGLGRLAVLYYDNRADPGSYSEQVGREVFSWRTRFWSAGAELPLGDTVLAAQWMHGSTIIEPAPGLLFDTRFRSFFVLAARDRGAWRPALRYDRFQIRDLPDTPDDPYAEDGHAWTAALNWRPRDWLRVSAEWLRIDSRRGERLFEGRSAWQREDLLQLNLRYEF